MRQLKHILIQVNGPGGTSEENGVPHNIHISDGYSFLPINLELSQPQKQTNGAPKDAMNLGLALFNPNPHNGFNTSQSYQMTIPLTGFNCSNNTLAAQKMYLLFGSSMSSYPTILRVNGSDGLETLWLTINV